MNLAGFHVYPAFGICKSYRNKNEKNKGAYLFHEIVYTVKFSIKRYEFQMDE